MGGRKHKSLLEIQLEQLKNVEDIRIVVGYKKELVIDKLAKLNMKNVKIYENLDYRTTGTATSFSKVIDDTVNDYVIALDGDLLVNPVDMESILNTDEEIVCGEIINTEDPVMVTVNDKGQVVQFSRTQGEYEWAGLAQLKKERIMPGNNHIYQLIEPILPINFKLIRAKEIDTPNDLEKAKDWIKENFFEEKQIIDDWFKSRFSIEDNYIACRYSSNKRNLYDMKLILQYVDSMSKVLDLGCGTGVMERELEKYVSYIKAVDKYREFLERAISSPKIEYEQHDISTYREDKYYDLIMMFGVSMYVFDEELISILRNCQHMMNHDSTFIIKNQWSITEEDYTVNKEYSAENKNRYFATYRSLNRMSSILAQNNFSYDIIDIYPKEMNPYGNTHEYAFVCKKKKR